MKTSMDVEQGNEAADEENAANDPSQRSSAQACSYARA